MTHLVHVVVVVMLPPCQSAPNMHEALTQDMKEGFLLTMQCEQKILEIKMSINDLIFCIFGSLGIVQDLNYDLRGLPT